MARDRDDEDEREKTTDKHSFAGGPTAPVGMVATGDPETDEAEQIAVLSDDLVRGTVSGDPEDVPEDVHPTEHQHEERRQ
jgi:hypothetical protein